VTHESAIDLLVLHAVRISGFADSAAVAGRFGLDLAVTVNLLRDAEARDWVDHAAFAGLVGWSLTGAGKAENERRLTAELASTGAGDEIRAVYGEFLPLNARLQRACTDWQLRPAAGDRLAANDHTDPVWDTRVLGELAALDRALAPLVDRLRSELTRFGGYDARFSGALVRARAGDDAWVDRTDVDSCHRVWFELHEDLVATQGLDRGAHV
jgi:hypothetical protein